MATPTLVRVRPGVTVRGDIAPLLGQAVFWSWEAHGLDQASGRIRPEVLEAEAALGAGVLGHYPGVGVVTHDFHWRNVVGPLAGRTDPTPREQYFDTPRMLEYGPDEYGGHLSDYRRAAGRDVTGSIQVNIMTGTAQDAADWVEYMNGDPATGLGAERAANGHPEPHRIALWEMGNEPHFTAQEIGSLKATEYAARVRQFAVAMKERDPSITVVAYVNPFPLGDPTKIGSDAEEPAAQDDPEGRTWSQVVIAEAGDVLDGLYFHWYGAWNDHRHSALDIASSTVTGLERLLDRAQSDIDHFAPSPEHAARLAKRIYIPEWNVFGGWVQPVTSGTGLQGALNASRTLHVFCRRPEIVLAQHLMVTAPHPTPTFWLPLADIRDGYAALLVDEESGAVLRTTLYEAFEMWKRAGRERVVGADVVNPPRLENGVPAVDVTVTADDAGVSVLVTNVGYSPCPVTVDLDGTSVAGGSRLTLFGYERFARNDWSNPEGCAVEETSFEAKGDRVEFTVPAHAFEAIMLPFAD